MENVCRVCAKFSGSLMDIFSKLEQNGPCPADLLFECVDSNVHLNDPFPKKICLSCVDATQNAFKFKRRYEQSHKQFCQVLNPNNIDVNLLYPECKDQMHEQNGYEDNLEAEINGLASGSNECVVAEEETVECLKNEEDDHQLQETEVGRWQVNPCICDEFIKNEITYLESDKKLMPDSHYSDTNFFTHFCDTCGEGFSNNTNVILHSLNHFNLEQNQCPYCPKSYKSRSGLKHHVVIHSGEQPYKCPHCSEAFFYKSHISRHILKHSNKRLFQCPDCDMAFAQNSALKYHMRSHSEQRRYKCNLCTKTFKTNDLLQKHLQVHSSNRPFQCPKCPYRFKKDRHLQNHIAIHSGLRPYQCNDCLKTFVLLVNLKNHNRFKCRKSKQIKDGKLHSIRTRFDTRADHLPNCKPPPAQPTEGIA